VGAAASAGRPAACEACRLPARAAAVAAAAWLPAAHAACPTVRYTTAIHEGQRGQSERRSAELVGRSEAPVLRQHRDCGSLGGGPPHDRAAGPNCRR
jgi:hypothetical protein